MIFSTAVFTALVSILTGWFAKGIQLARKEEAAAKAAVAKVEAGAKVDVKKLEADVKKVIGKL